MGKLKNVITIATISTALLLGPIGGDAAAGPLVRQCSQAHADQINNIPDARRYAKRGVITMVSKYCGWTLYEDYSVQLPR